MLKAYYLRKYYEVFLANSILIGLRIVREDRPDTVFLDASLCAHAEEVKARSKKPAPHTQVYLTGARQASFRTSLLLAEAG